MGLLRGKKGETTDPPSHSHSSLSWLFPRTRYFSESRGQRRFVEQLFSVPINRSLFGVWLTGGDVESPGPARGCLTGLRRLAIRAWYRMEVLHSIMRCSFARPKPLSRSRHGCIGSCLVFKTVDTCDGTFVTPKRGELKVIRDFGVCGWGPL